MIPLISLADVGAQVQARRKWAVWGQNSAGEVSKMA